MNDLTLETEHDEMEFSLADIAQLDASEIAEVRFENLPVGVFAFRVDSAKLVDTTNAQDERRIVAEFKFEVVECKSCIDRTIDKDALIGKKHTEKFYVVPSKAAEGLGMIRAFIGDIGVPNEGPFGGVEGTEPGIIDATIGHEFPGRIIHQGRKGDPTTKDARLRLDKKSK